MRLSGKVLLPFLMLLLPGAAVVLPAREMPAVAAELANCVAKPESSYAWASEDTRDLGTIKGWRLKLTSQVWEGITWTHDLLARSASRDFRKARWESQPLEVKAGEPVVATLPKPGEGYVADYADLNYRIDDLPQWLCTQLQIAGGEEK